MKDKWTFGPKFKSYLAMNLEIVRKDYIYVVFLSLVSTIAGFMALSAAFWLIKGYTKLYSTSLYQKEACLYQSVPVSAFETAAAKMVTGTLGLICIIAGLAVNAVLIQNFNMPQVIAINPLALSIMENAGAGVYMLKAAVYVLGAVLVNGIALLSSSVGNHLKGSRDKKPKMWAVVTVAAVLLGLVYLAAWCMKKLEFLTVIQQDAIMLAVAAAGTVLIFYLNVKALERWYSA